MDFVDGDGKGGLRQGQTRVQGECPCGMKLSRCEGKGKGKGKGKSKVKGNDKGRCKGKGKGKGKSKDKGSPKGEISPPLKRDSVRKLRA